MIVCYQYKTVRFPLKVVLPPINYSVKNGIIKYRYEEPLFDGIVGLEFIRAGGEEDGTVFKIGQTVYIPIAAWKIKDPLSIIYKHLDNLEETQNMIQELSNRTIQ